MKSVRTFVAAATMLMLVAMLLSAGCSTPVPSDPDEDQRADTEVTDIEAEDVGDAVPEVDVEKDVIPPKDGEGTVLPDEVDEPDEISEPDEVGEDIPDDQPIDVEQCILDCEAHEDCEGTLEGEDTCHVAECKWSEDCGKNQCFLVDIDGCCTAKADCDDGNDCTENNCEDDVCSYPPKDPPPEGCGEVDKVLVDENFEDGIWPPTSGILKESDSDDSDNVGWSVQESPCGGSMAIYMGDPECLTYYNGSFGNDCEPVPSLSCTAATEDEDCPDPNPTCNEVISTCTPDDPPGQVEVALTIEELVLPENSLISLTFKIWLDTEPIIVGAPTQFDILRLYVKAPGQEPKEVYNTEYLDGTTNGECVSVAVDLSEWAGEAPALTWKFDTFDGTHNTFAGIYLDDLKIATYEKICSSDAECSDDDLCTTDTCLEFKNPDMDDSDGFCVSEELFDYCVPCDGNADCINEGPNPDDAFCYPHSCAEMLELSEETNFCQWLPNPDCCDEDLLAEYWAEGFEGGADEENDWEISMLGGNEVGWHLLDDTGCPDEDTWGFYFGTPAKTNYDCGNQYCHGTITSDTKIDLTGVADNQFVKLTFCLLLSTERAK